MTRLARRIALLALLVLAFAPGARAAERYAASGMVLTVDFARRTFVASIDRIPGFMEAMSMPFEVRDARDLAGLLPGATIDFTLVVDNRSSSSYAEGIRIRRIENLEQDPIAARRLSLLRNLAGGGATTPLTIGDPVPDFTLTDQQNHRVSFSAFRGRVVVINFMYTACQLPQFCVRMVNHFGVLQKRFPGELGRDLIFLTITFDPARDQPDVLARYARRWKADPAAWHFLTGSSAEVQRVLQLFGVSAFPDEGLMDHSLHTLVIHRNGMLAAKVEGNHYSSDQLADLIRAVLRADSGTTATK
jgi:protein SCO1